MIMKKQTAVEWLVEQLQKNEDISKESPYINSLLRLAKAMEKEQIKLAFGQGSLFDVVFPDQYHYRAEDYYLKHYGL